MTDRIQTDYPDTDHTIDDDSEPELDDFYHECDTLYNKLVDVNAQATYLGKKFKKDSRTWLHKNRKDDSDERDELDSPNDKSSLDLEDGYEFAYSVIDKNGRRFKKDSRVWLHKVSKKSGFKNDDENTSCDKYLDEASLTAISQITIGRYGRDRMEKFGKKCFGYFRTGLVDKIIGAGLQRTRKRRKMGVAAPLSALNSNEMNFRRVPTNAFANKQRRSEVMFSAISESAEENLSDLSDRCTRTSSQDSLYETKTSSAADETSCRNTKQSKSDNSHGSDGDNSPLTSEAW